MVLFYFITSFSISFHLLPLILFNFRLKRYAITEVPTKVADQYSHKLHSTPESKAGANDRAGYIDAPEIRAKKKISKPTRNTVI
jgi:hypothetical protein